MEYLFESQRAIDNVCAVINSISILTDTYIHLTMKMKLKAYPSPSYRYVGYNRDEKKNS